MTCCIFKWKIKTSSCCLCDSNHVPWQSRDSTPHCSLKALEIRLRCEATVCAFARVKKARTSCWGEEVSLVKKHVCAWAQVCAWRGIPYVLNQEFRAQCGLRTHTQHPTVTYSHTPHEPLKVPFVYISKNQNLIHTKTLTLIKHYDTYLLLFNVQRFKLTWLSTWFVHDTAADWSNKPHNTQ